MSVAYPIVFGITALGSALVALPEVVVRWAARISPEVVFSVGTRERVVALSIDDGPSEATPEILAVLEEHGAAATFFLIGDHVRERPGIAHSILDAGHEVGHHMMRDVPSRDLPPDTFALRFDEMHRELESLGGSRVFRPGSGWYDDRMVGLARSRGYRTVLGSAYPFDAHIPWPAFHSWYILQRTTPGAILILHDGPERGARTATALRTILPELQRRGYRVVSISTVLDLEGRIDLREAAGRLATATSGAAPPEEGGSR